MYRVLPANQIVVHALLHMPSRKPVSYSLLKISLPMRRAAPTLPPGLLSMTTACGVLIFSRRRPLDAIFQFNFAVDIDGGAGFIGVIFATSRRHRKICRRCRSCRREYDAGQQYLF